MKLLVIISSLIIQVETGLFHLIICSRYKACNKTNNTFIRHRYHAKFKMAAMKSLKLACTRQ